MPNHSQVPRSMLIKVPFLPPTLCIEAHTALSQTSAHQMQAETQSQPHPQSQPNPNPNHSNAASPTKLLSSCRLVLGLQPCPSGTVSAAGATACNACPAGFQCLAVDQPATACAAGQYSELADAFCHDCGLGFACPTRTNAPIACAGTSACQSSSSAGA